VPSWKIHRECGALLGLPGDVVRCVDEAIDKACGRHDVGRSHVAAESGEWQAVHGLDALLDCIDGIARHYGTVPPIAPRICLSKLELNLVVRRTAKRRDPLIEQLWRMGIPVPDEVPVAATPRTAENVEAFFSYLSDLVENRGDVLLECARKIAAARWDVYRGSSRRWRTRDKWSR
jgi:hypothetical protein